MRSFVTGASGFIGSALRDELVRLGQDVISLDTEEDTLYKIESILERVGDEDNVFLLGAHADVAYSAEHPKWDVDENLSPLVQQILAAQNARTIVLASSFGGLFQGLDGQLEEEDLPNPIAPYFVGKLAGEHYLRVIRGQRPWVALRLANVYGPGSDHGVIADWCQRRIAGEPLDVWGSRKATRDYVYIDDVVDAFVRAGNCGRGIIHIGTGGLVDLETVAAAIWTQGGAQTVIGYEHQDPKPGYIVQGCRIEPTKALDDLEWRATTELIEGIRRTYQWWEAHLES